MQRKRIKDITIKDIATHLGISHPTVSRALRDHPSIRPETRDTVKKAARELGYIPNSGARMLRQTRSELVGVIFPDVQNDFYSVTMSTLAAVFLKHGYKLVLATSEDQSATEFEHIKSLREARVAGVIIAPTAGLSKASVALLNSIPTIQLLRKHPGLTAPFVGLNERSGIALAVNHLIGKSHRRIGFIGGFSTLSTGLERAEGYTRALDAAALNIDNTLLMQGLPRPEFGRRAMLELLSHADPPTAVVIASPEQTVGGLAAIQERNVRVPGQLALIAYHDPDWFKLWGPGLSCIRLPVHYMADAAAALLLQQLQPAGTAASTPQRPATDVYFESSLILRGSA